MKKYMPLLLVLMFVLPFVYSSCEQKRQFDKLFTLEESYRYAKNGTCGFKQNDTTKYKNDFIFGYSCLDEEEQDKYIAYRNVLLIELEQMKQKNKKDTSDAVRFLNN